VVAITIGISWTVIGPLCICLAVPLVRGLGGGWVATDFMASDFLRPLNQTRRGSPLPVRGQAFDRLGGSTCVIGVMCRCKLTRH
jgi:hypothetical protein